jgi:hypothetical protein
MRATHGRHQIWMRLNIRSELKRRNLSYADLAERLTAIGVKETELNVNNKIARGIGGHLEINLS